AELRLDPPELGPVQVRVSMHNDQVNVTFNRNQIAVREALDQGAQRLRDMFAEQGLNLGDVNVSDRPERRKFDRDCQGSGGRGDDQTGDEDTSDNQVQTLSLRLVDHYA